MESKALVKLAIRLITLLLRCKRAEIGVTLEYDPGKRIDVRTNRFIQTPSGWEITVGNLTDNLRYSTLQNVTIAGLALLDIVKLTKDK